ncbi:MAG: hydrogenase expression/formation protein HypE [Bacteroidales bacterium]|nr:hydrogenase expression/formation protein HypE [Bacteroidales bacterium]
MSETVTLNHGSGGRQSAELIKKVFVSRFGMSEPLTDSAVLEEVGSLQAFTTDSYVVDPVFFPGGNIGKLAVCGTVNDLAVSGAVPVYIAASFIIEEGFPIDELEQIAASMKEEAEKASVRIVTGDTKVVGRGKCDRIFITTAGTGKLKPEFRHISTGARVKAGDRILVNGPLGNHAVAILGARNNLSFSSPVASDCACLNHLIQSILEECGEVHFMRDLTRGGLAAVMNELARISGKGIDIDERPVPLDNAVKGLCEIMGFDPLFLANEGKVAFVIGESEYEKALNIMLRHPLGIRSAVIGEITGSHPGSVNLITSAGGKRILESPSGILLPRIC